MPKASLNRVAEIVLLMVWAIGTANAQMVPPLELGLTHAWSNNHSGFEGSELHRAVGARLTVNLKPAIGIDSELLRDVDLGYWRGSVDLKLTQRWTAQPRMNVFALTGLGVMRTSQSSGSRGATVNQQSLLFNLGVGTEYVLWKQLALRLAAVDSFFHLPQTSVALGETRQKIEINASVMFRLFHSP